jgi:hypothetical protein
MPAASRVKCRVAGVLHRKLDFAWQTAYGLFCILRLAFGSPLRSGSFARAEVRSRTSQNAQFQVFDGGHNYYQESEITKSASARIESPAPVSMFE